MPKGDYLQYGGQAIIEGVMMRSPHHFAVACRAPNGKIVLHEEPLEKTWVGRQKWLKLPFLRGTLALLDAMALGIRALNFSSKVQLDAEYAKEAEAPSDNGVVAAELGASVAAGLPPAVTLPSDGALQSIPTGEHSAEGTAILRPQEKGGDSLMKAAIVGTMVAGLALGVLLFVATPVWLSQLFKMAGITSVVALNLIEGFIKAALFIGYIGLVGMMKDVREVFKYHGAEHKAINALEAGDELNLEAARAQTRLHPRCGTSFAIIVLMLSIIVFTLVPRDFGAGSTAANLAVRIGLKLLVLPFIAGIGYEAIRIAGKFRNEAWVRSLFMPGLMTQYLTTREPDDGQIEVALVALRQVVAKEKLKSAEPEAAPVAV